MSSDLLIEPSIGQQVLVTRGLLAGLRGILIEQRDSRWVIQPLGCAQGVVLVVDSSFCR